MERRRIRDSRKKGKRDLCCIYCSFLLHYFTTQNKIQKMFSCSHRDYPSDTKFIKYNISDMNVLKQQKILDQNKCRTIFFFMVNKLMHSSFVLSFMFLGICFYHVTCIFFPTFYGFMDMSCHQSR